MFEGADMEDFNDGDAGDTEEVGGVGGEEAGLDDANDLEDEGGGGASDSDVETCIKKIVLIFKEAEFEVRIARAVFDLLDAAEADSVDGDLQAKEDGGAHAAVTAIGEKAESFRGKKRGESGSGKEGEEKVGDGPFRVVSGGEIGGGAW